MPDEAVQDRPLPPFAPGVYLVATPIGNLEDITLRALRLLREADVLACEDTRVTRKLFQRYQLSPPKTLLACNDHNERVVAKRLARMAAEGSVVAFCSDAGMPGISDPGYNIAKAAREAGVLVEVVPGPSAVTMAVALCGLPVASFVFFGFPPRRDGRLSRIFMEHAGVREALVFYESPRRLARLLAVGAECLGAGREVAVCLELTKKFQRVVRGGVGELAERFGSVETRGEAVVVFAGLEKNGEKDTDDE